MAISHSSQLVVSLLEYCDIPTQQFEEENKALLSIDRKLTVLIVVENRLIHLIATVGSALRKKIAYRSLLADNSKSLGRSGPRYSIDSDNDELIVSVSVDGYSLDLASLIKILEDFIALCEEWLRK